MAWDKQEEHNRGQRDASEGKHDPPSRDIVEYLADSVAGNGHEEFREIVEAYEKGHESGSK